MDIRYLAGFFDGEGSVAIYKNSDKRGYCLRFQLTQNVSKQSTVIVDFLRKNYSASINVQDTLSGKKKYNIALSGWKAAFLLEKLEPYLIIKREQTKLALKWHHKKPKIKRNNKGHVSKFPKSYFKYSKTVYNKLRKMKK